MVWRQRPQLRAPPAWSTSSCRASLVCSARQHGRGFGETDGVFRCFLHARSRDPGLMQGPKKADERKTGRNNRQEARIRRCRNRTSTTTNQPSREASSSVPFVTRGSALRPAPFLAPPPFAAFPEKSRRGAFLLPGRVTPRIHQSGEDAPPLPLLTQHDDDPDEDSRGRNSSRSFRREIFGREMSFRDFAAATPLPSPVPRRSWPRDARVQWRVAKMVVV